MTAKKKKKSANEHIWVQAMYQYNLSELQVLKAKKLGLNPKKFRRYSNNKQQPWKKPLGAFIDRIYSKQFKGRPIKQKTRSRTEVLLDDIEALIKQGYRWYIKERLPDNYKKSGFLGRVRRKCEVPDIFTKKTKGSCQLFLLQKKEFLLIGKGERAALLKQSFFQSEPVNLECVPLEIYGFRFAIQKPFRVKIVESISS